MCDFCGHDIIENWLALRAPEDKIIEDFLSKQIEILNEEWERTANEALENALEEFNKRNDPEDGIEEFLTILFLAFQAVVSPSRFSEYQTTIEGLYDYFKTRSSLEFKTQIIFGEIDRKLVQQFAKDGPFWIDNFYNTFLSERISTISRNLLDKGFTKQQIAERLRGVISKELALAGGTNYAKAVPKKFAGHVNAYNEIVTSAAVQRIRSFTDIINIYNAGYQTFVYTAVLDKRTCARCVALDGSTYSVRLAYQKVEQVAYAESPAEFKEITPWYNTVSEVQNLSSNDVPIPPIHGRCRCLIRIV